MALEKVALKSQRTIKQIIIDDIPVNCRVIPAPPDGDCGLIAIQRYLKVIGKSDLAEIFTRTNFTKLISALYRSEGIDGFAKELINDIFKVDRCGSLEEWIKKFDNKGYWLQEAHFKFLSYYFNFKLKFYYLSDNNQFEPELGNEEIDLTEESD